MFSPLSKLGMKVGEVNTLANIFRMLGTSPLSRKDELKNMVLNRLSSWICMMYYRLAMPCSSTLNRSSSMKFMNLSQRSGVSMYDRKLSRNYTELAFTAELPTWNSMPIDSMACPLMYLTDMIISRSM